MIDFILPESITAENLDTVIYHFNKSLKDLLNKKVFRFNFSKCNFISPTGMVYISLCRDLVNSKGIITKARIIKGNRIHKMLNIMGLLSDIKSYDEWINALKKYSVSLNRCMTVNERLNIQTDIMNKIVKKTNCIPETFASIDYMLNEIADNAGVHGYKCYKSDIYPQPVYLCAFAYQDTIEISIADSGHGIYKSLKNNNPSYINSTIDEVLQESIKNGVSGHPYGSPGFGLYSSKEFVLSNGGTFYIRSSGKSLIINPRSKNIKNCLFSEGTIVSFKMNRCKKTNFEGIISSASNTREYLDLIESLSYE
jgi:anti-sigma regulatory factor (Ser/Thr protein kinase)